MPPALDSNDLGPYSLPFRTLGLKVAKQRPVGSVGVEALLGPSNIGRFDKYCGVNRVRRDWFAGHPNACSREGYSSRP